MVSWEEFQKLPVQYFMATCYTRGCEDAYIAKRVQCQLPPEVSQPSVTCGVCGNVITSVTKTI